MYILYWRNTRKYPISWRFCFLSIMINVEKAYFSHVLNYVLIFLSFCIVHMTNNSFPHTLTFLFFFYSTHLYLEFITVWVSHTIYNTSLSCLKCLDISDHLNFKRNSNIRIFLIWNIDICKICINICYIHISLWI